MRDGGEVYVRMRVLDKTERRLDKMEGSGRLDKMEESGRLAGGRLGESGTRHGVVLHD